MDTQLKDVAARIRELRTIAGLTEAEMAEKTEVTEERYKVLEQGETDFGFTFIYKCAHVFGVARNKNGNALVEIKLGHLFKRNVKIVLT